MAYTNSWDESLPLGSAAANTVDDVLRQEKLDLRERINSLMGVAIGTAFSDPIIAPPNDMASMRAEITALEGGTPGDNPLWDTQTFTLLIHWSKGFWHGQYLDIVDSFAGSPSSFPLGDQFASYTGNTISSNSNQNIYGHIDLGLPTGVTITAIDSIWNSSGTLTPVQDFKSVSTSGSAATVSSSSGALTAAGYQTKNIFTGTQLLAANTFYWVEVTASTTGAAFAGLKVTYTSPNANVRI